MQARCMILYDFTSHHMALQSHHTYVSIYVPNTFAFPFIIYSTYT